MPAGCSDAWPPSAAERGASLSFAAAFLVLCAWGAPISSPQAQPVSAAHAPSGDQINGQRLAQRYCGQCHAIAQGASPLPDAPPFPRLFTRYRPGRLDAILAEGMLAPSQPPEEGSPRSHPRMPMAKLDDDQIADLKAYLRGLDPRIGSRPAPCRRCGSGRSGNADIVRPGI
jgi:mono/diheme cytochrome c family protein